jgi:outer membrane protein
MKSRNRRFGLKAALIASVLLGSTAAVSAESLRSALTAAYNNSNLLDQRRALLRASDEDVAIAFSALRPQISAQSTITHSDRASNLQGGTLAATLTLGIDLLVYDAGATQFAVESAKETVLAARAQLVAQEQQVLFNAAQAYVNVLRESRTVGLRERNLRLITQELRAARDRFDVGEVTRTDVAQAEARLAQARGALSAAQGDLAISRAQYRAAIGHEPHRLTGIGKLPHVPHNVADARRLGARENPNVTQAQREIVANELNVARAKAQMMPQINLSASVGHSRGIDNNSSVGLTMNVPIYQGGRLSALVRRAQAAVHASRSALHQTVLSVETDVTNSWAQLVVANAQVDATDRQIRAAQIAFDGVREEAKLGSRTTLDVLDAEQALFNARNDRVVAETQVYTAYYQLLASMGQLTAEKMNLAVQAYDPKDYYNAVSGAPVRNTPQGAKLDRILKRYE